jgi:hypothetical protein
MFGSGNCLLRRKMVVDRGLNVLISVWWLEEVEFLSTNLSTRHGPSAAPHHRANTKWN